jgi:hypothetical protein
MTSVARSAMAERRHEVLRRASRPVYDLAKAGWLVELVLEFTNGPVERRYFAVGLEHAADAEEAVLRYPGLVRKDSRTAMRPLTSAELTDLALERDTIRPCGFWISSAH